MPPPVPGARVTADAMAEVLDSQPSVRMSSLTSEPDSVLASIHGRQPAVARTADPGGSVMASDALLVERIPVDDEGALLGLVTMNRPDDLNPLDWETGLALGRLFDELAADEAVRVVAVLGAGRAFSAGGDMKKYQVLQRDPRDFPQFLADLHEVFGRISQQPVPFLALVNGIAVAGGIELMLSCDLAFASTSARIGDAHLPYGQMGGGGSLTLLPRAVGPARARELVLSGRMLAAEEALDWG